ncbi:cbb3-type cytochrome c oxidase subunit 3 [Pseudenhygromyxa sp. WMMC2535]|uniref:cbb3-type cytochrome c oxidase subunit 3 n=1 Tax=Pseudenhygromyxa sp. WMMC2535 TaxID=2712867 RepID=UPI001558247C|nr:cbb3-type cytochrome c oxidase subunit 3 [Pseudenhygromyxa sp. WMMC2535]NVB40601.1 cbb3-type cytochrome c oxidase subunit 3 [Pseudenhygromyxa sp. WMMC2535]
MKNDILSLSEYAYLAEISIVIFVSVFLGALYRILRPGAREAYEAMASMPLDDQNPVEPLPRTAHE